MYPNDVAIYISSVNKDSLAAKKLRFNILKYFNLKKICYLYVSIQDYFFRVNDCILKVNDLDCSSISKESVLETIKTLSSAALVVRRKKQDFLSRSLFTTKIQPKKVIDHGITLETGIYIKKIKPGSMTDKVGNLAVGDRVLSVSKCKLQC